MREEKIHKVPITELLPITCSFSLPLREVSGSTQGCVSWKEHLKSGPPQLIERGGTYEGRFPSSYLWGQRKSGSKGPTSGCHPHRPGNCLGSLHNCRKSAPPLHSWGKQRLIQGHCNSLDSPSFRRKLELVK